MKRAMRFLERLRSPKVAILIVHGGASPKYSLWIELCLKMIRRHTMYPKYKVFVWNNNQEDREHPVWTETKNLRVLHKDPKDEFENFHCVPLQFLYEAAVREGYEFIVTMDTDSFPIDRRWLNEIVEHLVNNRESIAGLWRDELSPRTPPYVHPSCFAIRRSYVEKLGLKFDELPTRASEEAPIVRDVLGQFTEHPDTNESEFLVWKRSNKNQVHFIMGGVYGDRIYHHGAGSRKRVSFWSEQNTPEVIKRNKKLNKILTRGLYRMTEPYLNWLCGRPSQGPEAKGVMVLGMHRSGTSCLAGCMAASGVDMGEVSLDNPYNEKGNYESKVTIRALERLFETHGGTWLTPVDRRWTVGELRPVLRHFRKMKKLGLWAAKDPRLVFFAESIAQAMGGIRFVGTYRPPLQVVASLQNRDPSLTHEECLDVWLAYNEKLVELHARHQFPLIKFDLTDVEGYVKLVFQAQVELGLHPDVARLRDFVSSAMFHAKQEEIPERCRAAYSYLESHRSEWDQRSWAGLLWNIEDAATNASD